MSGRDVLVVLMNFARPQNMPRVVTAWKGQTERPGQVVVVDNQPLDKFHDGGDKGEWYPSGRTHGADDTWRFTENLGCFSRIVVATAYQGYRYVLFADDDLLPGPRALGGLLHWADALEDEFATLGQFGRVIDFDAGPGRRYVAKNAPRLADAPAPCDLTCRVHLCHSALLPGAVEFRRDVGTCQELGSLLGSRRGDQGNLVTCPGCDGAGLLSHQWAKDQWVRDGGTGKKKPSSSGGFIYFTGDGREIPFKTIGGPCRECQGRKVVDVGEATVDDSGGGLSTSPRNAVGPGEDKVNPLVRHIPSSPQGEVSGVRELLQVHDDILLAFSAQVEAGFPSYVIPRGDPERELAAVELDDGKGLWRRPGHFSDRNRVVDLCVEAGWKPIRGKT